MENATLTARQTATRRWSKEKALGNIAMSFTFMSPDDLAKYFPFEIQETSTAKSYRNYRDSSPDRDQLPHPSVFFSPNRLNISIDEINLAVAKALGIRYKVKPTQIQTEEPLFEAMEQAI